MKRRKQRSVSKPSANATVALHERLMNEVYIRRRGYVMRRCKHLKWLDVGTGPPRAGPAKK